MQCRGGDCICQLSAGVECGRLRTEEEGRQLGGRPMSDSTYYDGEAAEEAEFAGLYYDAPFDWPEPEQGEDQSE